MKQFTQDCVTSLRLNTRLSPVTDGKDGNDFILRTLVYFF